MLLRLSTLGGGLVGGVYVLPVMLRGPLGLPKLLSAGGLLILRSLAGGLD